MSIARGNSTLVVLLFLFCLSFHALAHTPPLRPLRRLAHPSTLSLDILPRSQSLSSSIDKRSSTLRHSDSFRLTISAFGDIFHLHLSPNEHLIHPDARVNVLTPASVLSGSPKDEGHVVTHSYRLERESVLAYIGSVIHADDTESRMREDIAGVANPSTPERGWARIMVHSQGESYSTDGNSDSRARPPIYSGAFSVDGTVYHVATKENYLKTKLFDDPPPPGAVEEVDEFLVIWRDSDVSVPPPLQAKNKAHTCAHDQLSYNSDPEQNAFLVPSPPAQSKSWLDPLRLYGNSSIVKRDDVAGNGMTTNFQDQIGQIDGCPKSQKILFMGVAADCKYVSTYGDHDNATTQILNNWNSASALYKNTFNVSLGIVELQVMNATCPSPADQSAPWNVDCQAANGTSSQALTLNDRLSLFSEWRGNKGNDGIGLWHLMSGCPTGSEVGIAWLATLCQQSASGDSGQTVSGTGVSTAGRTEWQVVAHEIGHNFGAIHDCADGCNSTTICCPLNKQSCDANSKFIMSPVAETGETQFSQCSLGNICSVMTGVDNSKTNTTCLADAAGNTRQTISLQMCGNGILEPGEDCDPGTNVQSNCCDSATCKFTNGAVCDNKSGDACCTDQCTFAGTDVVCRPSKDAKCDQQETCTGNNATCPTDKFSPNGQSCGSGDLACASGQCTSVSQQCQTLGASMGLKSVCPNRSDQSCQVSCQDPNKSNACIVLNSMLIDGSPCGYGGTCTNGKCQSAGFLDTAKAWYTQNLQISIPVTVVAGLLALAILVWLIRSIMSCMRRRAVEPPRQRLGSYDGTAASLAQPVAAHQPNFTNRRSGGYAAASGGGFARSPSNGRTRGNWVDESMYNGPRR